MGAHKGTGNSLNNVIKANNDSDYIDGGDGKDTITGGSGQDSLMGGEGDDKVDGGAGNDVIIGGGGLGNDFYNGGAGIDTVEYPSATTGIVVNLTGGTASGDEIGTDQLSTIENVMGGKAGDTIKGDASDNVLNGYTGNDTLSGGAGNDTFLYDPAVNSGLDNITDFAAGDRIRVIGANFNNPVGSGNGSTVITNQVQLSSSGELTTLLVGTDITPGADLKISLAGIFTVSDFYLNGADIQLNGVPTLTRFTSAVASGKEDDLITVSFANVQANGNEADDGTVNSFVVKAVTSGSLKIGLSADTAALWNVTTNNSIDATHNTYWTPVANDYGVLNAFTVTALDNRGASSATPVPAQVSVTAVNDAPVLATPTAISYTDTIFDDDFLLKKGILVASDIDNTTGLSYGISGGTDDGLTVSKNSNYGVLTITKATGAYSFAADDAAIEALTANTPINFTMTVSDGSLSISKTLTIINIAQNGNTESIVNDTLTGTAKNDKFNGLAGADTITGGSGNDTLDGGAGKDSLTGGLGMDVFSFTTAPSKANVDTITDFTVIDDTVQLDNAIFAKLGTVGVLKAANFVTGAAAVDANDFVIYNNGALLYDADGSGIGVGGVQIALLGVNLALTNADFVII